MRAKLLLVWVSFNKIIQERKKKEEGNCSAEVKTFCFIGFRAKRVFVTSPKVTTLPL